MKSKRESQGTKPIGSIFKHIQRSVLELLAAGEIDLRIEAEAELKERSKKKYTNQERVSHWYDKKYLTPAEVCRCPLDKRFKDALNKCTDLELKEIWEILIIHRFDFMHEIKKYSTYEQRYITSDKLRYVDEIRNIRLNKKTVLWKPN